MKLRTSKNPILIVFSFFFIVDKIGIVLNPARSQHSKIPLRYLFTAYPGFNWKNFHRNEGYSIFLGSFTFNNLFPKLSVTFFEMVKPFFAKSFSWPSGGYRLKEYVFVSSPKSCKGPHCNVPSPAYDKQ